MLRAKVRPESWFAAAILAVLTITVFERLRDFGPASAVRRFHAAVYRGEIHEIEAVTVEPRTNPKEHQLELNVLTDLANSNLHYEVARMDLAGNEVRAAVLYYGGTGSLHPVVFGLERDGQSWKVSAERTIFVQDQLMSTGS